MTLENITNHINANAAAITKNLAHESIEVHKYLMQKFSRTNVAEDLLFQFLYRSFYRLDNAGLTAEFKTAYFNIFEEERANQHPNIKAILQKLRNFKNKKGQENVQFSFATKLVNTINNRYPIYDSEVARVFGYSKPLDKDFDKKIDKYLLQFQHIREAYDKILAENLLKPTIELFDNRFQGHSLPEMKRLDFIFWSAGKLLKKEAATRKEPQQLDLASA